MARCAVAKAGSLQIRCRYVAVTLHHEGVQDGTRGDETDHALFGDFEEIWAKIAFRICFSFWPLRGSNPGPGTIISTVCIKIA